jgi:hypothetical protein
MAMRLKWNIWMALLLIAWSCTEQIEIELDRSEVRLVVDGSITDETAHHMIRLTTTTGYFYNYEPPPVKGANVRLIHNNKSSVLNELTGTGGYYALPMAVKGVPGETYQLDIRLNREIGGSSRYTAETTMPTTDFHLDSTHIEYNDRFDFWLVKVYARDPMTKDFYKFETYLRGINGNDTTMRTTATPDRFFNGKNTNGFAVAFFDGELLVAGDTLTTVMSAITEDYLNFYTELRSESGFSNPLFAGPPANIRSNLKEGGLGYFTARKVQRTTLIVPSLRPVSKN